MSRRPTVRPVAIALAFAALAALVSLGWPEPARADCGFEDPAVFAWLLNDGSHGQSPDPTIDAVVSTILADVERVRFTATNVYVEASGIPSYPVGPFPGNPNVPGDQNWVLRIPRFPVRATPGSETATGLGPIGVWVNGVVLFNAKDAMSYQNRDVWHQNAVVVEAPSFDAALGHPAPNRMNPTAGVYHHHQRPVALLAQLGEDGVRHSPLVGFAYDGYPIYGPHGFANADGSGGVVRLRSSWALRAITQRHELPDGTVLPMASWGPDVSATYPLGYYVEDFEHVAGSGDLDEHDGRFTVTPEYPAGTYAYFTPEDAAGASAYPYAIGPTYAGVVAADDLRPPVTVPAGTCTFSSACVEGDCPGACTDGMDDDLDGSTDCLDSDCAADPACASADADADGVVDSLDCAPADPSAWSIPAEVSGLVVTKPSPGATSGLLTWTDDRAAAGTGGTFEVASEDLAALWARGSVAAPCVATGLVAPAFAESTVGSTCFLVRAVNACGPAAATGWGSTSTGVPRAACP